MNMVRHQTIRQYPQAGEFRVLLKQMQVNFAIGIGEENALAVGSSLRAMMGDFG